MRRFGPVGKRIGITRLADVTGLDRVGLPVCLALRPTARSLVTSIGKGSTPAAAKVGALMESIETWHAEQLARPERTATQDEMAATGRRAVEVTELPRAYGGSAGPRDPRPWVRGVDLGTRAATWVPFESVSMDFVTERLGEPSLARNSNGLASGNTLEQAVLHGLCEVVERDAESRWRADSASYRVDLDTVTAPECRRLIGMVHAAGLRLAVWDVTSHTGVPCYGCVVLAPPDLDGLLDAGVHDGFGCAPSPAVAFAGAVREALQKRLTYIAGSRDDLSRDEVARVRSPELVEAVWDELDAEPADVDFRDRPTSSHGSYADDLRAVVAAVTSAGRHTVVAVDLTRPDLGVPVAKVVVTGMEGPYGMCESALHDVLHPGSEAG